MATGKGEATIQIYMEENDQVVRRVCLCKGTHYLLCPADNKGSGNGRSAVTRVHICISAASSSSSLLIKCFYSIISLVGGDARLFMGTSSFILFYRDTPKQFDLHLFTTELTIPQHQRAIHLDQRKKWNDRLSGRCQRSFRCIWCRDYISPASIVSFFGTVQNKIKKIETPAKLIETFSFSLYDVQEEKVYTGVSTYNATLVFLPFGTLGGPGSRGSRPTRSSAAAAGRIPLCL